MLSFCRFVFFINPNPKFGSDIQQDPYLHSVLRDLFLKTVETP